MTLSLIGVTGTKGKTTTCHLLADILEGAGFRAGLVSSIERRTPSSSARSQLTTPEAPDLQALLRRMSEEAATHAVLEISSIGIAEGRIAGLAFDALLFTNLGRDHWTYHGSREAYVAAKRRIFEEARFHSASAIPCVVNSDDGIGAELAASTVGKAVTFGIRSGEVRPDRWSADLDGIELLLDGRTIRCPLTGDYNVYNVLGAYALARSIGCPSESIAAALSAPKIIPGRTERVGGPDGVTVFVDYAHTPESVAAVTQSFARLAGSRRRVVVLGAGGQTDRSKRPAMGLAAANGSDLCMFTDDNPRGEASSRILSDLLSGVPLSLLTKRQRVQVIEDRRRAIETAIAAAQPDGIVLVLGKGDEETQIIGNQSIPFSDHRVALECLAARA